MHRRGAKPGDLIYVSGPLGSSAAGLKAINNNLVGFEQTKFAHLEPKCRIDIIDQIAPYATAMIDISDGLASEVHHLCKSSTCGALINASEIPVSEEVYKVAKTLGLDPLNLA